MNIPNHSVYLICSKTGTWLSTLISWCSHLQYAHASISFDESFERLYSFGRTEPDNPFSGGFVIENLYDGVYTKFQDCRCLIYRIPVTALQYEALSKLIERFILEKETYSYNMLGLFGILFNTPIKRKSHYFCSQFVAEILIESGIFSSSKVTELITTDDLLTLDTKEFVFEGPIDPTYIAQVLKSIQVS